MTMRNITTASFTGHRIISKKVLPQLIQRLDSTVESLVNQGTVRYLNGGALGFDTHSAHAVLRCREKNPLVKLIMALPCLNQDERWSEKDKEIYKHLLNNADEAIYVSDRPYFNGCMLLRNKWLVENSDICIAYMLHGRSGASQTVRLARKKGLQVINLAES